MCFWGGRPGGWGLWGCSLHPRHGTACHGTIALCIECWRGVKCAGRVAGGLGGTRVALLQHSHAGEPTHTPASQQSPTSRGKHWRVVRGWFGGEGGRWGGPTHLRNAYLGRQIFEEFYHLYFEFGRGPSDSRITTKMRCRPRAVPARRVGGLAAGGRSVDSLGLTGEATAHHPSVPWSAGPSTPFSRNWNR